MAASEVRPALPPGLLNGLLFFGVVVVGSGYIVFSKLHDFGAFTITTVPVVIMVGYALLLWARLFRLRDDQAGDNLYYMGFLFTLTSLAVSLYQFSASDSAEQIVQNFGIAIASTIAGITLRILFNQMRRDPLEVEATARLELAEASRRVKRELESAILEFGYFRRMTQQSIGEALDEVQSSIKNFGTAGKPFGHVCEVSVQTLDSLNEWTVQILEVSKKLVQEGEQLASSTTSIVQALDTVLARLAAMQTPEQGVETRLGPMIEGLTGAVNSLGRSVEMQAKEIEVNLGHTQNVVIAIAQVLQEMRTAQTTRAPARPWISTGRDR